MARFFLYNNEKYGFDQVVHVEETAPGSTKITFSNGQVLLMTTQEARDIFGKFV